MVLSGGEILADFLPFAVFLPEGCTTFAAEFGSGERDVGASYGILAVGCCLAEGGDALYSNENGSLITRFFENLNCVGTRPVAEGLSSSKTLQLSVVSSFRSGRPSGPTE